MDQRPPCEQAYLYKWRKDEKARIADARAAKEAEKKELEAGEWGGSLGRGGGGGRRYILSHRTFQPHM